MTTKISTKGQVVLPQAIRRKMNLRAGDLLEARIEGERIVLTPRRKRSRRGRIIKDPLTGYPVLTAGKNAPVLTQKEVEDILSEFP
ncbi:MAG TPA: AbrB/MazE/SpoVT family DNA-binding domain-containing protein [Candidatus Acidoferrales bacterium]|nr:AbrB/MazE/SpoVT family DNA-binding domain-containing protein [Candidatus Acidoferrales bacterium]